MALRLGAFLDAFLAGRAVAFFAGGRRPPAGGRRLAGALDAMSASARHRGEHGDLIVGAHRGLRGTRITVNPHLACGQHVGESLPIPLRRGGEYRANRVAIDHITIGTGRLAGIGEQSKGGHSVEILPRTCSPAPNKPVGLGYRRAVTSAQLLIIRHGQSTWNEVGRWQGSQDPPLTQLGIRQAKAAAEVLGSFDSIVSSPLERAHTTACLIADAQGVGPVSTDPGLTERCAGEWEGRTRDEIETDFPGWLASNRYPDGWEDDDVLLSRSAAALGRIAARVGDGGTALVVSHGGLIHNLERFVDAERKGRLPNLAGRWFEIGPGRFVAGESVTLVRGDEATVPDQI